MTNKNEVGMNAEPVVPGEGRSNAHPDGLDNCPVCHGMGAIAGTPKTRAVLARPALPAPPEPNALRAAYKELAEAACNLPILGVMPAHIYRHPVTGCVSENRRVLFEGPPDGVERRAPPQKPPAAVDAFSLALHRMHVVVAALPAEQRDPSLVEDGVYAPTHPDTKYQDGKLVDACTVCRGMTGPNREANAQFIADAPGDIRYLLELVGGSRPALAGTEMSPEEARLRRLLWLRHGCPIGALYGDDGELSCGNCLIDFKRWDAETIANTFDRAGRAALSGDQGGETVSYRTGGNIPERGTNPVASLAALLRERAMKLISDNSLSISRADPAALAHGKAAGLYEAAAEIEARGVREPLEFCEMSDGSRMPACEGHPTGEAVKANMRAGAAPPREPPPTKNAWEGCPCTIVAPCSYACSCANPVMSGGCLRCCKYGSPEQRRAAAERLAELGGRLEGPSAPPPEDAITELLLDEGKRWRFGTLSDEVTQVARELRGMAETSRKVAGAYGAPDTWSATLDRAAALLDGSEAQETKNE